MATKKGPTKKPTKARTKAGTSAKTPKTPRREVEPVQPQDVLYLLFFILSVNDTGLETFSKLQQALGVPRGSFYNRVRRLVSTGLLEDSNLIRVNRRRLWQFISGSLVYVDPHHGGQSNRQVKLERQLFDEYQREWADARLLLQPVLHFRAVGERKMISSAQLTFWKRMIESFDHNGSSVSRSQDHVQAKKKAHDVGASWVDYTATLVVK